jgi:hypothetical protein
VGGAVRSVALALGSRDLAIDVDGTILVARGRAPDWHGSHTRVDYARMLARMDELMA